MRSRKALSALPLHAVNPFPPSPAFVLCGALLLVLAQPLAAQYIPDANNATCTDSHGNRFRCGDTPPDARGSGGNTPHQATPGEIALHNCLFHGKCRKANPVNNAPPQPDYVPPPPAPAPAPAVNWDNQNQAEELRRQQEETAERARQEDLARQQQAAQQRQNTFNALKAGMADNLIPVTDSNVVDLRTGASAQPHGDNPPADQKIFLARFTDSQARVSAEAVLNIPPPFPIPDKDLPITFDAKEARYEHLDEWASEVVAVSKIMGPELKLLKNVGPGKFIAPAEMILIAGKGLIATEDGAACYLVRKDEVYEDALRYLKDPEQRKQFVAVLGDIRAHRPYPATTSNAMLAAARALADPRLGSSALSTTFDALTTHQAVSAGLREMVVETASTYLSSVAGEKVEELTGDLVRQKRIFAQLRAQRALVAKRLADPMLSASQREQYLLVQKKIQEKVTLLYRTSKLINDQNGVDDVMGELVDKIADKVAGPQEDENPGH